MSWILDGEAVPDDLVSDKWYGFIYKITYTDGMTYYGRKNFFTERRAKPLKGMRKNAKRIIKKESSWRDYTGSTKLATGKQVKTKEILKLCETMIDLTYWETYYLMVNNVLFDENCLNQNIMGKFYSGKITGTKEYLK
jgi:predicted PolB exonuclease-like 3'-5' exonuclease